MAIFDLKAACAARRNFATWFQWAIRSKLEPTRAATPTSPTCGRVKLLHPVGSTRGQ